MIYPGYNPKAECLHVEQLGKHHCHVPAEVWGITPEMVCAICLLKNHHHFVAAAMVSAPDPNHQTIPFRKPRLCIRCSIIQLDRAYWESGERVCGECRWLRRSKLEQQCGR